MNPPPAASAWVAIAASAAAMTIIVALRYVLTSGAFAWASERRAPGLHARLAPQIRREIGWSLASAAIYGIPTGVIAWGWQTHGWTRLYQNVDTWPRWWLPVSFVLCLVLHDSWFYWTHRLLHRPGWFRAAHAVHHASRPPTAWAAMSFHPLEALTGAVVIPALVFIMPLQVGVLLALLAVMTFMGVTNHMGWEIFPQAVVKGRLGKWLITATHHQLHHERYRCNYGLYFRFWDRLAGTDDGLGNFAGVRPKQRQHDARRTATSASCNHGRD